MSRILKLGFGFGFLPLIFFTSEIIGSSGFSSSSSSSTGFQFQLPDASVDPFFGRESFLGRFDQILEREGAVVITGVEGVGKTETVLKYIHGSAREVGSTIAYNNHIWIDGETDQSLKEGFWKLSQMLDTNLAKDKVKVTKGQAEAEAKTKAETEFLVSTTTTKELATKVYEKIQAQNKLKGTTLIVFDNVDSKNVDILELLPKLQLKTNGKTKNKDKDKKYHGKIYVVITSRNLAADWGPVTSIPLNPFVFPEVLEILLDQLGFSSKSEREELETFFMERMSAEAILGPWATLQVPLAVEFIKERTLHHMDNAEGLSMDKMEAFVMAIQDYFNQESPNVKSNFESESESTSNQTHNATSESQSKSQPQRQPVKLERENIKMIEKHADSLERAGEIVGALEITEAIAYSQEMALGEEHEETLDSREKIARLLTKLERPGEALKIYQNVYETRKRLLGPDHFQTVESLEGVGGCLVLMEEWEAAIVVLEEAFDWNKRVLGEDHRKTEVSRLALEKAKKELGRQSVAAAAAEKPLQKKGKDEL